MIDKNIIKKFYLDNIFNGYTNKMPNWLAKQAKIELYELKKVIQAKCYKSKNTFKNWDILDIGCGNCRMFNEVYILGFIKNKYACDIFNKEEIPFSFLDELKYKNIQYETMPYNKPFEYYNIPFSNKKFDIVTCFGVDIHLPKLQKEMLLEEAWKRVSPFGLLVWQTNRDDTRLGKKLKKTDKHLDYQYMNSSIYYHKLNVSPSLILESEISRTYVWQK